MKVMVWTLLLSFLFVAGGMAAEAAPATPQTPAADAAFFCSLPKKAEPVTKIFGDPVSRQEKSTVSDCASVASQCLRANCECSEVCGGSVAQSPCVPYPRQWRDCICA